jgi:hypothetical protein
MDPTNTRKKQELNKIHKDKNADCTHTKEMNQEKDR